MIDYQLLEAVDACRPGSDDLHLPEFSAAAERVERDPAVRALYDRLQVFDARLVAAVHDVSVPEGLSARLLAAIAEQSEGSDCSIASRTSLAEAVVAEKVAPMLSAPQSTVRRRAWLRWSLAASVLLALGVSGYFAFRSPPDLRVGEEQMANEAADWHLQAVDTAIWDATSPFPVRLAPSPRVAAPRRFADISELVGRPAAIYDLAGRGQPPATLLVIEMTSSALPAAPPSTPRMATANLSVGCWQSDGLVFALVVQGDSRRYQQFLSGTQNGLAMLPSTGKLSGGATSPSEIAWRF